ncbi:MAG: hypothetical protein H7331_00955 [Bacteroidia bacterium]|nr:hypothetical protein [Bacteroidia bacterium]
MDNQRVKIILFIHILAFLWVPIVVSNLNLIKEKPLHGYITQYHKIPFALENWFTEKYQQNFEQHNNQNFGFRNTLLRIHNQWQYSLFNSTTASAMIVGKNEYLYGDNYVYAYTGENFVGYDSIMSQSIKIKKLQDTLLTKGIDFLIAFAPGKGTFMPEYIPDKYLAKHYETTNLKAFVSTFNKLNITHINFSDWFDKMKPTAKYPLYPQAGWHWSNYGQYLTMDSILHYMEALKKVDMPNIILDSLIVGNYNTEREYDGGHLMNLYDTLPTYAMAQPYFHFDTLHKTKIKTLVIGDSYYDEMWAGGLSFNAFDNGNFWYYNRDIYDNNPNGIKDRKLLNIKQEIEKNKFILLMPTNANIYKLGFGFIEEAYEAYFNPNYELNQIKKERINKIVKTIKTTPSWLAAIEQQAVRENISLDKAIQNNAEYVLKEENKKTVK